MTPKITKPKDSIGALYAFWPYDQYPYFCYGEVTRMHESGAVVTKEYGEGNWWRPVLVVPLKAGLQLKEKLQSLERAYKEDVTRLKKTADERLLNHVPELATTRKR